MGFLSRVLSRGATPSVEDKTTSDAVPSRETTKPSLATSQLGESTGPDLAFGPLIDTTSIDEILKVEEVSSAEFYAGDLFRRRFGGPPPDYPRHFVALYRARRLQFWPLGYIHYTAFEDSHLCGGMVMDDRLYRRVPLQHRTLMKASGGVAEYMLRQTFARLQDSPAIWGYVGDKQAESVDLRVGFRHTTHPHIMVVWNQDLAEEERQARLARVIRLGPF